MLSIPHLVIQHITLLAASEGYTRDTDLDLGPLDVPPDHQEMQQAAPLPNMMTIDCRPRLVQLADLSEIAPDKGVDNVRMIVNLLLLEIH